MPDYLVFQLAGPWVSWGEVAPGEIRGSYRHPSKSAILGLVAGAMGYRRDQEAAILGLNQQFGFGVYWHHRFGLADGNTFQSLLVEDYHTSQVDPINSKFTPRSRVDELSGAKEKRSTILSNRQYLNDAFALVALWATDATALSLETIKSHIEQPTFAPYLGRKACSPGLPFSPQVIQAEELLEAFKSYPAPLLWPPGIGPATLVWEDRTPCQLEPAQRVTRRDSLTSRQRWQYEPLTLCVKTLEA